MISPAWFFIAFPLLFLYVIITAAVRGLGTLRRFFEYLMLTLGLTIFIGLGILLAGLLTIDDPRNPDVNFIIIDLPIGLVMLIVGLVALKFGVPQYGHHIRRVTVPKYYEVEKLFLTFVFFIAAVFVYIITNQYVGISTKNNDFGCCLLLLIVFGTMFFPFFHERLRPVDAWAAAHGHPPVTEKSVKERWGDGGARRPRRPPQVSETPQAGPGKTVRVVGKDGRRVQVRVKGRP